MGAAEGELEGALLTARLTRDAFSVTLPLKAGTGSDCSFKSNQTANKRQNQSAARVTAQVAKRTTYHVFFHKQSSLEKSNALAKETTTNRLQLEALFIYYCVY